ncbi:contact-dependent growth inhibition system immunity protein [Erwinia sorbitola]|uniref:CdiI immunity protein domain-containing protein n=1 Tax=Erwinia sorbitola TaxID=2681984 RepID=A0A6I6ENX3_9GAMM|nr:contact-dependent growth inhibition system immunity protein [Erwinia sorbitola]QGU87976.1 hypothetical protein GN242_12405 [Erwinia sorbitola]
MKKYESMRLFFKIFFGQDAEVWGETYQEIIDAYVVFQDGVDEQLIVEVDDFLACYPDNSSAKPALEKFCGGMSYLRPSPVEFLIWLSAYLKQKREAQ